MHLGRLLSFGLLLLSATAGATGTDSVRQSRNSFHSTTAVLVGSGTYSGMSGGSIASQGIFKEEYRRGNFYANAGICLTYMQGATIGYYSYTTSISTENKFLVGLPVGVGYIGNYQGMTMQAGVDVPYTMESSMSRTENGFAIAPYYTMTWDVVHKKRHAHKVSGMGFIIRYTANLQRSETYYYDPGYWGVGIFFRNY
jgi:hypothetical protein